MIIGISFVNELDFTSLHRSNPEPSGSIKSNKIIEKFGISISFFASLIDPQPDTLKSTFS